MAMYRKRVTRHGKRVLIILAVWLGMVSPTLAASPLEHSRQIKDPAAASRAEYGRIDRPGAVSFYSVTPSRDVSVAIEAVVPVRGASAEFRPAVAVLQAGQTEREPVPFPVPDGYGVRVIPPERSEPRPTLFDPNSIERFYRGGSETFSLAGKRTAYLVVYDPGGRTGDYILGVASSGYYENASRSDLLSQGIALKFGAAEGRTLPWWDAAGALLAILGVVAAGLVAFGALLTRPRTKRSLRRWQRWLAAGGFLSLLLFYGGVRILNRDTGMIAVASFQDMLAVALLLGAIWLAVQKPDRPPAGYRTFAAIWTAGWLAEAALLVWYLLVTRLT